MNVLKLFTGSFHSVEAYRTMRRANNFGMGYALFLVAISTLLVCIYFGVLFHQFALSSNNGKPPLLDSAVMQIAEQMPVMTFTEGTLVTKEPVPTVITLRGDTLPFDGKDFPLITIDTTGQSTHANMNTPILVTAKEIIVQTPKETKIKPLSEFSKDGPSTVLINKSVAMDVANQFITGVHDSLFQLYLIVGSIVWFGIIVFVFIMRIFMLLFLGLVGLAIAGITKSPITYPAAVGLASLSYTPIALLDGLLLTSFGYAAHTLTLAIAGSVTLFVAMKCSEPEPATPTPAV